MYVVASDVVIEPYRFLNTIIIQVEKNKCLFTRKNKKKGENE